MAFEFAPGATIGLQKRPAIALRPSLLSLLSHPDLWRFLRPALEGVAGLVIAAALPALLQGGVSGPEAMLLVVVLMAARYGFGAGVATGILAAMLFLTEQGLHVSDVLGLFGRRAPIVTAGALPLIGALVGLIGDAHRHNARRLTGELRAERNRLSALAERHSVLVQAKEHQDRRIVGQVNTLAALYDASCALSVLDPERIPPAALELIGRLLQAQTASWFRLEADRLALVAAHGPSLSQRLNRPLDGTVAAWLEKGRGIHRQQNEVGGVTLTAAVRDPQGRAVALVVVERVPFLMLHGESEKTLELVADWAGRSLANAQAHVEALEGASRSRRTEAV